MSQTSKPKRPPAEISQQLEEVYLLMARNHYRPAGPIDTVPTPLELKHEAEEYARCWWGEEDGMDFFLGCCDFRMRPAVVLVVEAARILNGGIFGYSLAMDMLRLALREAERAITTGEKS